MSKPQPGKEATTDPGSLQTGEQGTDSKETALGDLEPKLPKTTASAPQPGRLANTSDF